MTAQGLYESALRDKLAARYDLARQEFQDYLKYYEKTGLAADALFYIGEIAYYQGELDSARGFFDRVRAEYPNSKRTPDAALLGARILAKQGARAVAIREFAALVRLYPHSDAANGARMELKSLKADQRLEKKPARQ
jgi:TolA-binding protein